jgi:8-oxo-dGTP pyrophosphatase MutT (NUDIX family)
MNPLTFISDLRNHFNVNYSPTFIEASNSNIDSSVSIIIRQINLDFEILFIKRTTKETDKFSGHMAFPGGVKEKSDFDSLSTAHRETNEEIGLNSELNCDFLGRFSDYRPVNPEANKFIVSPFIFFLRNAHVDLVKCKEEVETLVWIPISFLMKNLGESNRVGTKYNKPYKDNVFEYKGYKIWGMTGKILYAFLLEIDDYYR